MNDTKLTASNKFPLLLLLKMMTEKLVYHLMNDN